MENYEIKTFFKLSYKKNYIYRSDCISNCIEKLLQESFLSQSLAESSFVYIHLSSLRFSRIVIAR